MDRDKERLEIGTGMTKLQPRIRTNRNVRQRRSAQPSVNKNRDQY